MFDIFYILSIMSYCVKKAEKTQNLSKIGGFHFFFFAATGRTNQGGTGIEKKDPGSIFLLRPF